MPVTVACSLLSKAVGAFLLAVLPVTVKTNAGKVAEGQLDGFTKSSVLLNQSGEIAEYAFDDLLSLRPTNLEEKTGPTYRVTLVGGSRIAAQDLSLTGSELVIQPRRQSSIRIPVKQVKAIGFRASSVATDAQWLGIVQRENRGDILVIRRPGDRLDPQRGVVVSIADGKVGFDLDGDVVNAPIDRLEGVVFGGTQAIVEDADIQVDDVYGSRWAVTDIDPSTGDQPLKMRLSTSLVHQLPLHQIESIRWSGGIVLLADRAPASQSFQVYIQTKVDQKLLEDFFGPRRAEADLLMFGGSSMEYRVEPGYRILAGMIRRHASVPDAGQVTVSIELDGKTVWREPLADAEPRGFELPLEESRRLAIKVDSGNDGDLGDWVHIIRPRLLK